ncbi:MAG: GNAT family N-acetyltransferase [Thermoguttaceae bacterium]
MSLFFSYITIDDIPDIAQMLAKEPVCRYLFFGPNSEDETRAYFAPLVESIHSSIEKNELPNEHIFTIRKKDGFFVGQCALLPVPFTVGNYTITFSIDDTCWRQGYGEEVCRFLMDYAFEKLKASRLSGDCFDANVGSQRIMEKCGFEFEGRQRRYWTKNGQVFDNLLFGFLRNQ